MSAHQKIRQTRAAEQPGQLGGPSTPRGEPAQHIKIGKTFVPREADKPGVLAEVFTLTLGEETIHLLPLKTWSQLDLFKWRARGLLPGTPAGLEITWDHLKIAGETVSPWDPDGCAKLEKAFNDWLSLETQTVALAQEKTTQAPAASLVPAHPSDEVVHFEVDPAKPAPRIKCVEGKETVRVVALNLQGMNALIAQGFMRQPQSMKVGVLHDWIELDGQLIRFKEGTDWPRELEQTLNEHYTVTGDPGSANNVMVFANPASPTGFDLQFPAAPSGLIENRKRHLNEETVQLLQDPERCRVLRRGITVKLAPPDLVFKEKTAEGGERYLEAGPENTVVVKDDHGQMKQIELSQPVSLLNMGVPELAAIFNHPSINRRARLAQVAGAGGST